jgi:hypothetical protein
MSLRKQDPALGCMSLQRLYYLHSMAHMPLPIGDTSEERAQRRFVVERAKADGSHVHGLRRGTSRLQRALLVSQCRESRITLRNQLLDHITAAEA